MKPPLLLDVDGCLLPLNRDPDTITLAPELLGWIAELDQAFEISWSTLWSPEDIRGGLVPALGGLGASWPCLDFGESTSKRPALLAALDAAGGRGVIIDDDLELARGFWPENVLIISPDPFVGLTQDHVEEAIRHARVPVRT